MASGIALPVSTEVVLGRYADCQAALLNRDLSRTFDRRGYAEGNVRAGIVSTSHGLLHRARRRMENTLFRSERLEHYERELFPAVLDRLLGRLISDGRADLFVLGELLSVVLSAQRVGVDVDPDDLDQLRRLVGYVDRFSQGSALVDTVGDAEAVRAVVREALDGFEADFLAPSRWRREREARGDLLSLLLAHRHDPSLGLDDGVIVRETATYLQGGTHTSSQTLINAVDLLLSTGPGRVGCDLGRVVADVGYAQRCVHETLRLRPTTPRIKRRAEAATRVGAHEIPEAALVVVDVAAANRDPLVFGASADAFDPLRAVPPRVHRWGLSFGAGAHQCPGRNVAGGFPPPDTDAPPGAHLHGLVALMLQAVARLRPRRDPARAPERDTRTERFTRWSSYPVVFEGAAWR